MCINNGSYLCQFWVWCYCWTWSKSKGHLHTWQDLFYDFQETFLLSASYNRVETSKIWCSCHSEHKDYGPLGCVFPTLKMKALESIYCTAWHHTPGVWYLSKFRFCLRVCERETKRGTHTHLHHHPQLQNLADMSDAYFLPYMMTTAVHPLELYSIFINL